MDPSWDSYGFRKKKRRSNDAALCKKNPLNVAAKKKHGGGMMKGGEAAPNFNTYSYIGSIWSNYSDLTRPGPPKWWFGTEISYFREI